MSDYRDVVRLAIEKGFYLDSCGEEERHYTWGSWIDLCGMDPEEANRSGGGSGEDDGGDTSKTKNTITFVMQKGSDNEYTLYLNAEKAPNADVVVSFSMDNEPHLVTLPAGTTSFNTGLKGANPTKPYAVITSTAVSSEDEQYTYKAKNSVKTGIFTLTVDNNGVKTTEQVPYGEPFTLPTVEEREGYDFKWTDANGAEITGPTYTMPEANATITGKYVAKSYTLTYVVKEEVLNGDSVSVETISSSSATLTYGTKIWNTIKNLTPAKTGYTLDGWKSSDGNVTSATTMPAKDLEVTNIYKLNKYTLAFNADGSEISSEEKYYGQSIAAPQIPDKVGYTTIGWDKEIPATMPASNQTFNAVYEAIIYYIRYSVDGTEKYSEEHIYGDAISIRADESKIGHTFSGWEPSALPATMPDADINVVGTFTKNTYHFTIYVDGQVYFEKDYEYEETVDKSEIADPTKEGYTFIGWEPEIPDTVPANDLEISAKFQINQYVLSYYVDGELVNSALTDYNAEIVPIAEPTKEGYTFSGWDNVPANMPASDVRIDGTFSINSYVLSYYVDGELVSSSLTEYDAEIVPLAEPTKEGYTFSGWDNVPAKMPATDIDVNGTFTVNTWNIKYFIDGELYLSEEHDYDTAIQIANVPDEKVGYTFSGWDPSTLPATMPNNDIEVNGTFNINQYTLSFVLDGEPYTSITADYDTDIVAPTVSSKIGYTFSGWAPTVPAKMPAEDMTFNGTYDINTWTATYYIDDEKISAVTFEYGETITYPSITPPEGIILKWNKEYETMPDHDIDIHGVYEPFVESNMIYYGFVNANLPKSMSTSGLTSYENENGVEKLCTFWLYGDPRYAELETDEDFDNWDIDEMNDYNILVPSSMRASVLDAAKNQLGGLHVAATGEIDGTAYSLYSAPATVPLDTDQHFDIYITATKN